MKAWAAGLVVGGIALEVAACVARSDGLSRGAGEFAQLSPRPADWMRMHHLSSAWRRRRAGEIIRCDCGGRVVLSVGALSYRLGCASCGLKSERLVVDSDGGVRTVSEPDAAFAREAIFRRALAALLAKVKGERGGGISAVVHHPPASAPAVPG